MPLVSLVYTTLALAAAANQAVAICEMNLMPQLQLLPPSPLAFASSSIGCE